MKHTMAIIGYGGMGGWHHKSISEKIPELLVKGRTTSGRKPRRKRGRMDYTPMPPLMSFCRTVRRELVTVATPNHVHKDLVIAACGR